MNRSWCARTLSVILLAALQACGGGGSPADPATDTSAKTGSSGGSGVVDGGSTSSPSASVARSGQPVQMTIKDGGVLTLADSPAQVTLPPAGLVYDDGTPASGNVTVTLATINPAADVNNMPGGYMADSGKLIESFGAIQVNLNDGSKHLQLAPGKTATIRIPVMTRSATTPATIPLFHFDEASGKWKQEGTAKLKGDVTSGQYYEGTVSHFSYWNADQVIETISVRGCVKNADGSIPANDAVRVFTDGIDYSGMATAAIDAAGNFTVAVKKSGKATLIAIGGTNHAAVTIEPSSTDTKLNQCLITDNTPLPVTPKTPEENFMELLANLTESLTLAMDLTTVLADDNAILLSPSAVCTSGKVSTLTFDGKAVAGGEFITPGPDHTLSADFRQCAPTIRDPGGQLVPVLNGQASAKFAYTQDNLGNTHIAGVSVLNALQDTGSGLSGSGPFQVDSTSTTSTLGQPNTTQTTSVSSVTFLKDATLTNLKTGRTLSFISGATHLSSVNTDTGSSSVVTGAQSWSNVTYTMAGATYVLNGFVPFGVNGQSPKGQVTLSKNGAIIATLRVDAAGTRVTGQVDPF
jgi:hypothetical protein